MHEKSIKRNWVMVNRAPALTLWAAVVAQVLGFEHDEALTLGGAVAGFSAYLRGVSLGVFQPTPQEVKEQRREMHREETVTIDLLYRAVPARYTDEGLRALSGESPIRPETVKKYLEGKFGDTLEDVSLAMREVAKPLPPDSGDNFPLGRSLPVQVASGTSVGKFLEKTFAGRTNYVGMVAVNGKIAEGKALLQEGDRVDIHEILGGG